MIGSAFNSILARVLALTFGLLVLTLAVLIVAMQTPLSGRVFDRAIEDRADGITELAWLIETSPPEAEGAILSIYSSRSQVAWTQDGFPPGLEPNDARKDSLTASNLSVAKRLSDREIRFDEVGAIELAQMQRTNPQLFYNTSSALHIGIALEDGRVLNIWLAPSVFYREAEYAPYFALTLVFVVAAMLGLAINWVIMRPIRAIEKDAELVGLSETSVAVSETGPVELRRLAKALNRMRLRLDSLIREREQMMVAIAHDIRTGLTKLRLRTDSKENVAVGDIEPDLIQMERLLADMMVYARAEHPVPEYELIELCSFGSELAGGLPYQVAIKDEGPCSDFTIAGSKDALARMLENLLENARRYGGGEITLRYRSTGEGLEISIEDNGPGLSSDELDHAFEPFFRGEGSRSRSTGGTGLGLGIARAIAHAHGATISLSNLDTGGLCASLFFPEALKT